MYIESEIREALKEVYDPELGLNIEDLGLIYGVEITDQGQVGITMTMTTPGCPVQGMIIASVKGTLLSLPGITEVDVEIVWNPPWSAANISEDGKRYLGWGN